MPKPRSNPYFLDEELGLRISDLKSQRCFTAGSLNLGEIVWRARLTGSAVSSVSIRVDTRRVEPVVELSFYGFGGMKTQSVGLVSTPSNLGQGRCYYFLCPETGRRCRVLHRYGDRFLHRSAIPGAMYRDQADSKLWRGDHVLFRMERLRKTFDKKHSRTHYNGEPTRRYRQLQKSVERGSGIRESAFKIVRDRMQKSLNDLFQFGQS